MGCGYLFKCGGLRMIELIVFYWIFAFVFLAGYSYRQDGKFNLISYLPLFSIAGFLFPFILGMAFYEKIFKL